MASRLPIDSFLDLSANDVIFDVRSPAEFQQGHIPGALNLPLFDDQQRAAVGITYKHNGHQAAVLKGLEIVGPRMRSMVEDAIAMFRQSQKKFSTGKQTRPQVLVHCWRGGMRSQSVAWLLEQADFEVKLLEGGYKVFRRHVLSQFEKAWPLVVLSGLTGAGKTIQLNRLAATGQQVIDLEALANHQGSAFGGLERTPQPTVEQFENELACQLLSMDRHRCIWIEDESQSIGKVAVPTPFFRQYRLAPAIFMDVPQKVRGQLLAESYGSIATEQLQLGIESIRDRLGGQNVNRANESLAAGDLEACACCLLEYYDKAYRKSQAKHPRTEVYCVEVDDPRSQQVTDRLLECLAQLRRQ